MTTRAIVINGGSSSGKSSIVRELQGTLRDDWLALGVDTFIGTLPARVVDAGNGIDVHADGQIDIGPAFTELENVWMRGVAAMARVGGRIIADDSFLGGPASQRRWREALGGVDVLWVGVRCDPDVAEERERARGDRTVGMAREQALAVHEGIEYDVEVDTSRTSAQQAAAAIRAAVEPRLT